MPLPIAVPIALGIGSSLAGMFGANKAANAQKKMQAQQIAEGRRQFDLSHGLNVNADRRQQGDFDLKRSSIAATSPQRQQIMAALMQRFGMGGGGGASAPAPASAPPMPAAPATAGPAAGGASQDEMMRLLLQRFGGGQ